MVISWDLEAEVANVARNQREHIQISNGSSSLKRSMCGTFHVFKMAGWDKVPGTCKTPPCQTPPPSGSCVASNLLLLPTHRKGNTESVNGVNRPATKGEKYYWLPTKREKNYRLLTGKILTDYRYGPAILSFFRKKSESIFLGSNQLYQRLYKFYWKDKVKNRTFLISMNVTSPLTNTPQSEGIKMACRANENFYKATHLFPHITCEKCLD